MEVDKLSHKNYKTIVWDVMAKLRYLERSERKIVLSMLLDLIDIDNYQERNRYLRSIHQQVNQSLSNSQHTFLDGHVPIVGNTFDEEDLEVLNALANEFSTYDSILLKESMADSYGTPIAA